MTRSGPQWRKRTLLLAVIAVVGIDLASAPAAAAPGDPVTAEDAASLVAERGHELEVLTEQFNEARENLESQQMAAAVAQDEVAAAEAALAALSDQLAAVAQTAYTGDGLGAVQAFMTSGSPEEFLDRIALLESVAGHHNDVLDRVAIARTAAEEAQAAAEKAAAEAQQQVDEVAAQQADLQSEIAEYQAQYTALTAAQREEADAAHGGRTLAAPPPSAVVADSAAAQAAVDTAMAQLGDPYVWAAAGPDSFDCSGLTQYAFAAAGISLPHSSRMQATMGQAVPRAELQAGDLVYFYSPVSHIGIYIGGGQMVHASTFGEPVKVGSVDMSGYAGARRIV
ncbi:C40 family peptidase [Geodermatophilus marinus]|uniref:C40 family peptidase n=1 Tax=Geodermatophilus sp. LHW52908 TaxID=2303986 RepID=UPI001F3F1E6E|nr:C40 family peptidase [Geodermatophilus sp. LHW52908]